MKILSPDQKAFLERDCAEMERRAKFPRDMGFHPLSDRFSEGVKLKTPWLREYLIHRNHHKESSRSELLAYLREVGAKSSESVDRFRGALLGLALGDSMGMPLEFQPRDARHVDNLVGGGPFNLKRGDWTDDTSMACCLAYSLIQCRGFNARHQMECYCYWYQYGAYTPEGVCVDIGVSTRKALERFLTDGEPYAGSTDPFSAGNGSLSRLAPVVLFFSDDFETAIYFAGESSRTTHQAIEAIDACRYFAALLFGAINGESKEKLLTGLYSPVPGYWSDHPLTPSIEQIARGSYKNKPREQIASSGYVVHTLEAALWAFYRNDDFRSGLLEAVNLADDADSVGAVYGQLAGAYYGETSLPIEWILHLHEAQGFYHFAEDIMAAKSEVTD